MSTRDDHAGLTCLKCEVYKLCIQHFHRARGRFFGLARLESALAFFTLGLALISCRCQRGVLCGTNSGLRSYAETVYTLR
jgi:hypothetical protein